jgi:hypothetical protein
MVLGPGTSTAMPVKSWRSVASSRHARSATSLGEVLPRTSAASTSAASTSAASTSAAIRRRPRPHSMSLVVCAFMLCVEGRGSRVEGAGKGVSMTRIANPLEELAPDHLRRRTSIKWRNHRENVLPLWAEMGGGGGCPARRSHCRCADRGRGAQCTSYGEHTETFPFLDSRCTPRTSTSMSPRMPWRKTVPG